MGLKKQERCMGCMKPLDWDGRCSSCGFDQNKYLVEPHYLPLGTLLKNGEYMVGRVLGEGGFGITYMGFDQNLLSRVAIKEYYPVGYVSRNVSVDDYTVRPYGGEMKKIYEKGLFAFLEEARILAQFGGMEGIVNVRNLFQENGTAYIIMEYVEGVSVRRYLREYKKINPELVLEMMEQPIQALQAVHEKQLVHRDVSADNFIIRQNGKLTLIDFGAARYSNALDNKTRTAVCKQGFSAIEQYSGEGKQGPWTDVYGICTTMYYMMTGIVPQNPTERVVDDQVVPLENLEDISLDVEKSRSIMMGMAVKSSDRFQNMAMLYYAVYGKPLSTGIAKHNIFHQENTQPASEGNMQSSQIASPPTGIIREALQTLSERKRRKKKKKIAIITTGGIAILLLVLLIWNLKGYADKNGINHENEQKAFQTFGRESANAPVQSALPSSSPVPTESVKKTVLSKEESKTVKMPKVTGDKKADAMEKIKKSGLQYKIVRQYSNSVGKGKVIRASIPAGNTVKKGKEITLYVSKGKKAVKPKATPKPAAKPVITPKPTITNSPVPQKPKTNRTNDDNLAGDLDSIIY